MSNFKIDKKPKVFIPTPKSRKNIELNLNRLIKVNKIRPTKYIHIIKPNIESPYKNIYRKPK